MYKNGFVVTVIYDGKVVTEAGDVKNCPPINIPFNSEYTLRLRNKTKTRAVAHVLIDGENVSAGGFVVEAQSFIDIERPVDSQFKFKFVPESSEEATDQGKNTNYLNKNGEIQVTWQSEIVRPKIYDRKILPLISTLPPPYSDPFSDRPWTPWSPHHDIWWGRHLDPKYGFSYDPTFRNVSSSSLSSQVETCLDMPQIQRGCTVPGTVSNQEFTTTQIDLSATKVVMKLKLVGYYVGTVDKSYSQNTRLKEMTLDELKREQELLEAQLRILELRKKIHRNTT